MSEYITQNSIRHGRTQNQKPNLNGDVKESRIQEITGKQNGNKLMSPSYFSLYI